jgi:sigma-E factor negative regulatory protein RseC
MNINDCIEQKGTIEEVAGRRIRVRMKAISACESCKTKSVCKFIDTQNSSIDVIDESGNYSVGEEINIRIKKSLGYKALFLGYILPFILVILFMIVFSGLGFNEILTGIISLSVLAVYYTVLYFFRNNIRKVFIFTLTKTGTV